MNNIKYTDYNSKSNILLHHTYSELTDKDERRFLTYSAEAHALYELMSVKKGKVFHSINGETYIIQSGDIVLVNIHELHSLKIDLSEGYDRVVLMFADKLIPKFETVDLLKPFHRAQRFRHIIPKKIVDGSRLTEILTQMEDLCAAKSKFADAELTSLIIRFLIELTQVTDAMLSPVSNLPPPSKPRISTIFRNAAHST